MSTRTHGNGSDSSIYSVRRFQPADASGLVECVRQIYGASYVHAALYDPDQIVHLNETEQLVSAVAIAEGSVIGHYALERADLGALAESGEAMVLPEYRHHDLMDRMRVVLEDEALRLDLVGVFGHVVTNHMFSQRVVERFGEYPCAVQLGWSPKTFHNMAEPLSQRMSELLYFKYLRQPRRSVVHLPAQHQAVCEKIYDQAGIDVEIRPGQAATEGAGEVASDFRPTLSRGMLRVHCVSADTPDQIRRAQHQMRTQGAEAIFLELPLAQAGTPAVCQAAEQCGFFFNGIGPSFAADGDALLLQWLAVELDLSLLQIDQPFARALTEYVGQELDRRGTARSGDLR